MTPSAHPPSPAAEPRPQALYRQELLRRIRALAPTSLLDVGCGRGDLIRAPELAVCPLRVGLEIDEVRVAELRATGFDARLGRGEALPFDDGSFDVVVFDYVAHHLEDLQQGLREAARVTKNAVIVLDPWYDVAIPSQRVALDYDKWLKVIDRLTGMIHNSCPSAMDLAAPFQAQGSFRIDYSQRLVLQLIGLDRVEADARAHLALVERTSAMEAALDCILDEARREGMSEDGAILFTATRYGV